MQHALEIKTVSKINRPQLTVALAALVSISAYAPNAQSQEAIVGFSHPFRTANVAAATSGIVDEWLVQEGSSVLAGQPLLKLDDKIHKQVVSIARAAADSRGELELAEAKQKLSEGRLQAIEALAKKGHATPDELHRAQTEAKVAAARLMTAREHQLRHQLEFNRLSAEAEAYTVLAPFDGVINQLHKLKGEFVGPFDPQICELADLTAISANFLVPQSMIGELASGDKATVFFPEADQSLEGTVTLSPYPDAETGMRSIKVRIENRSDVVKAGWPCQLRLGR